MDVHRQCRHAVAGGAGIALAHPFHQLVGHLGSRARPDRRPVKAADADGSDVQQRPQPARRGGDPRTLEARAQIGRDPTARLERRHGVGPGACATPPRERGTNDGHGR